MIAIHKGPPPSGLISAGEEHAKQLCEAYDANPERYQTRSHSLEIRRSIYAADAVKQALEACHHGKCCYCETVIPKPYAHSHVEHWRPKSSSRQGVGEEPIWPGYYWLAYSWDNLLLSCFFCNSSNKSDVFPIEDPATRARHHRMRIENEIPAILKPDGNVNPADHITFHMEVPEGLTDLGRKTIEVLGLDSPAHELRLRRLEELRQARQMSIDLMHNSDSGSQKWTVLWRTFVEVATRPDMPYSAMAAAFLAANPLPEF